MIYLVIIYDHELHHKHHTRMTLNTFHLNEIYGSVIYLIGSVTMFTIFLPTIVGTIVILMIIYTRRVGLAIAFSTTHTPSHCTAAAPIIKLMLVARRAGGQ